jgi:aryl carrier-like protein
LWSDGTLECLGRLVSGQVKIRGQRVELSEIEQTIIKVDGCYSAITMVIDDTLIAFCALDSSTVSSAVIQEICRQWLPSYMVPGVVHIIDRMPQLPSGKVDRKALEATYLNGKSHSNSSTLQSSGASGNPFNSVFESVLGRVIADEEDFTSVGMDSLRSIRIASALREKGFDVGSIDILTTTNIKELYHLCKGRETQTCSLSTHSSVDPSRLSDIAGLQSHHDDIADILPCTPSQEAMLTETAIKPGAYCNWIEVELSEPRSFLRIRELLSILVQVLYGQYGVYILRAGCMEEHAAFYSGRGVHILQILLSRFSAVSFTSIQCSNHYSHRQSASSVPDSSCIIRWLVFRSSSTRLE